MSWVGEPGTDDDGWLVDRGPRQRWIILMEAVPRSDARRVDAASFISQAKFIHGRDAWVLWGPERVAMQVKLGASDTSDSLSTTLAAAVRLVPQDWEIVRSDWKH